MTDTLDQLDAELDCYLGVDITIDFDAEPSALLDIEQADYALRRIARIDHEMKRNEAIARHQVEKIQAWLHGRSDILLSQREWWVRSAEGWMRSHNAETGVKTEKLPSGTLSLRKAQPKVEVDADPVDAPEQFVKVVTKWDRNAIKQACSAGPEVEVSDIPEGYKARAAVTADGEQLPGVVLLVPTRDSFSLKAGD